MKGDAVTGNEVLAKTVSNTDNGPSPAELVMAPVESLNGWRDPK